MVSHKEAQELHELIGAAIESGNTTGLERAREITSLIVGDTDPDTVGESHGRWTFKPIGGVL